MEVRIYCKTTDKGMQTFYANKDGKDYFLFNQAYRKSNKSFFAGGYYLREGIKFQNIDSQSVKIILEKIIPYLQYIEKEYGVEMLNRTKNKEQRNKRAYKREKYRWQNDEYAFCYEENFNLKQIA